MLALEMPDVMRGRGGAAKFNLQSCFSFSFLKRLTKNKIFLITKKFQNLYFAKK